MRDLVPDNNSILRKRGEVFDFENPKEDPKKLAEELVEAMYKYEGIGLSACQIGVDLRVFSMIYDDKPIVCFNPHIDEYSTEKTYITEGCLSFPGLFFPVERAYGVNVRFTNEDGQDCKATFVQLASKVFQHEYDHMLGKLYIDQINSYKLRNARKKQKVWQRKRKSSEYKNIL